MPAKKKPTANTITPIDLESAAECLRVLAHPVRLQMIQMLLAGQHPVSELASACGTPDNVASEHLRLLQRCGFLTSRREGRRVYYEVAEPHLCDLLQCIETRFAVAN